VGPLNTDKNSEAGFRAMNKGSYRERKINPGGRKKGKRAPTYRKGIFQNGGTFQQKKRGDLQVARFQRHFMDTKTKAPWGRKTNSPCQRRAPCWEEKKNVDVKLE